jgi:2-polyprenyl-3-methyl-5-hydroxy-6-metoxy-1,4-benzoquinol methylase
MQNIQTVRDYYLSEREQHRNIYQIWETGGAFKDSITPSTACEDYRSWIVERIQEQLFFDTSKKIISIGCGNAFVEQDLNKRGYNVLGIDVNESAVELAQKKGVPAIVADIFEWRPGSDDVDLIYCDGVLGHLYFEDTRCGNALARLKSWLSPGEGILFISNDASKDGREVAEAPGVKGFYHFSEEFVVSELTHSGFEIVDTTNYVYERPLSGARERLIVVARA